MAAPAAVVELVERFDSHRDAYRSGQYNEAQLREEFLNPFFEALGWDVYNRNGCAEAYKEVIHEAAIKVGGRTKAPDYCFRVGGGVPSFFVEAKKPSVDIREAVSPAYQLRRYAWSAKLPVSILTDFEEWAVYDCRVRPVKTDRASTARVMYHTCAEYPDCWDELAGLFSPQAIRRGALDKFVASKKIKKGTAEVDDAFLDEIQSWRELLARNIALRNPVLSQRDLNFAVQRTIDRIVFLRICEDRGIEPYGTLQGLSGGPNVYPRLGELFQRADDRYNSGLFHFTPEKGRPEPPDELTLGLAIDDKVLRDIIRDLYYPDSPYEFSVLPVEILGHVYEQFLGKVIRLTAGHRAVVEDKPEVKKAGGVYYTPTYIVDYIVEHTVGKLLEGESGKPKAESRKAARRASPPLPPGEGRGEGRIHAGSMTPKEAANLRILDPACGSGSFLIGAYEYLLKWHRDWYEEDDPQKHARGRNPKLYRGRVGDWRLTTAERKRILLNSIYGVDIDPQAVEVTKLSLLLKVLEGESQETLSSQLRLFHERALPDLASNIKCGNSLIGPDFYENRQMSLLDEEERYRINAFDWQGEFPQILKGKNPGFDAVIGNPPWVMAGYYIDLELDCLKRHYQSAEGKFDLYYLFIELGTKLMRDVGYFGMIVPNKFFHTRAARNLRSYLASGRIVHALVDFGYEKVFSRATNYSCIMLCRKLPSELLHFSRSLAGLFVTESFDVGWSDLGDTAWHLVEPRAKRLFAKMVSVGVRLSNLVERFGTGIQTGADSILCVEPRDARKLRFEKRMLRPIFRGRDVRRYHLSSDPKLLIFPYCDCEREFVICDENTLKSECPRIYSHLQDSKQKLSERVWFGKNARQLSGRWFGMMYVDSRWAFTSPHLLTPSLSDRSNFALGNGTLFASGTAGVTSVIPKDIHENILYLLGVLNSRILSYYAVHHSPVFQGGYFKFSAPYLKELPIRRIDFADQRDICRHDGMVELVEHMLSLREQCSSAATAHGKTVLQRQIDGTDREIDRLVYELYELTEEEIAIVEEATGGAGQ